MTQKRIVHVKARKHTKKASTRTPKPTGHVMFKIVSRVPFKFPNMRIANSVREHVHERNPGIKVSPVSKSGKIARFTATITHIVAHRQGTTAAQVEKRLKSLHPDVSYRVTKVSHR